MKKKALSILMVAVLLLGTLAACSANKDSAPSMSADYKMESDYSYSGIYGGTDAMAANSSVDDAFAAPSETVVADRPEAESYTGNMVTDLTYGENVKLIFRAWLNLQTQDFAQAESELNKLVEQYRGYFESVYTDNGSYWSSSVYLRGTYTVRIPSENYDRFLAAIGNTCHIVSLNKTTEDIGLRYADTQMRLETARAKQERLLALLKQATEMSDIIELENAISNCQYQIDSLTSTMNRYDSLIGYSTINIELEQVARLDSSIVEKPSFWKRLGEGFREGLEDFLFGVQDLIIWAAYHLVGIAIFVVIVVVIVKVFKKHVLGKLRLGKKNKKGEAAESANADNEQNPKNE